MTRFILAFVFAAVLSGCRTGTTILIDQPMDQVSTAIRHHFDDKKRRARHPVWEPTAKSVATLTFTEDFDKSWTTDTRITIESEAEQQTRITVFTEHREARGFLIFPCSQNTRKESIEGHRMAEILKVLDVQPYRSRRDDIRRTSEPR